MNDDCDVSSWVIVENHNQTYGSTMLAPEPDYEAALGIIKHLSIDELKDLMNDDDKVTNLVKDLPQVKNLASEKEVLVTANKSIADYTLSFETKLSQGKKDLISKYEEYAKALEEAKELNSKIESSSSKQSPDAVLTLLQTAAHELEEESEELVKSFLNNELSVESFLSEFISQRTKGHERKIKSEKLADLIKNQSAMVIPPSYVSPYPAQMPSMPMPLI